MMATFRFIGYSIFFLMTEVVDWGVRSVSVSAVAFSVSGRFPSTISLSSSVTSSMSSC